VGDLFRDGTADFSRDVSQLLADIERGHSSEAAGAECRPPLDVVDTSTSVEVLVDLPGVAGASVRVALRHDALLIVGTKAQATADPGAKYHVAERSYGRFARAVRLTGAFDGSRARATMSAGQLRVVLPLIEDRRGRLMRIPVESS
jgi:HSP20 family protein